MSVRSGLVAFAALILSASPLVADPPVDGRPSDKAREDRRMPVASDLSGEWRMFLPAGWERIVRIDRLGEDRYYVHPPYVMKGTYEVRDREMAFVSEDRLEGDDDIPPEETPPAKSEGRFVWTVRSPYLMTLTSGAGGYRDAILFRSNGREVQPREAPEDAAAPTAERSSRAEAAPISPRAVDLPETRLNVRLYPGEQGTRSRNGELGFLLTVRNDSDAVVEFRLPGTRGGESSIYASTRPFDPSPLSKAMPTPLVVQVYRADEAAEESVVTIRPGEKLEIDAQLGSYGLPLGTYVQDQPQRKYEIELSMTFTANGTLQRAAGPRGSVVTFDAYPPER